MTETTECWIWPGATTRAGYGLLTVAYTNVYVHRLAWMQDNGPLAPGQYVCHTCDTPACYRIDHLFIGTQKDNMRDASRKGRLERTLKDSCKWGHAFTEENTYTPPGGQRQCRACRRRRDRERREHRRGRTR